LKKTQVKHKTELKSFETQNNDGSLYNECMCFNYDDLGKKHLLWTIFLSAFLAKHK
jgi:hypothetical protein